MLIINYECASSCRELTSYWCSEAAAVEGASRMPERVTTGSVRPPKTTVVKTTIRSVLEMYTSRCSPGICIDCDTHDKKNNKIIDEHISSIYVEFYVANVCKMYVRCM